MLQDLAKFMMNSFKKRQKGQFLIELLVAIGIGAILTGALVALGSANTRRASVSRQSNEATKLAQEGTEIVRHIRDSSLPESVQIAGSSTWNDLYSVTFGNSNAVYRVVQNCLPGGNWCLRSDSEGGLLDGIFTRRIFIRDNNLPGLDPCGAPLTPPAKTAADVKRVHVEVSWNSPIGTQTRESVTCLTHRR